MQFSLETESHSFSPPFLSELAELWNSEAYGRHAFYPWTSEGLADILAPGGRTVGTFITTRDAGALAGFSHIAVADESGYPRVGVVENILVGAAYRRNGLGTALLAESVRQLAAEQPRVEFLDALGAWPFGYAFNVLADGSERSGVFLEDAPLYRLFRRAGFEPVRKSIVMRADLRKAKAWRVLPDTVYYVDKRHDGTWLDRVFRGRELWDHYLVASDRRILSRSIFGFMEGESRREGKAIFSLFGVNTPETLRGRGYAGVNLSRLMEYVKSLGGEYMELHVYADNEPALRLYKNLGFKELHETVMMRKQI